MKLADYMKVHNLTYQDVAHGIGVQGIATIYRYNSGDRHPSARVLRRIYEFTNGKVTANDFFHSTPDQSTQQEKRA